MDSFNWFVLEILSRQAVRERLSDLQEPAAVEPTQQDRLGVKHALASYLVRVGLRLDPAAGDGLRAPKLPLAQPEAGQRA